MTKKSAVSLAISVETPNPLHPIISDSQDITENDENHGNNTTQNFTFYIIAYTLTPIIFVERNFELQLFYPSFQFKVTWIY